MGIETPNPDLAGDAIDADALADIIGGEWQTRPEPEWRYRGLCYGADKHAPGRIVLARSKQFRYGMDPAGLNREMRRCGIIVDRDMPRPDIRLPILRVDSIPPAVRRLARHVRANSSVPIVAITGTVGKTSSCYLLHHVLSNAGRVTTNGQANMADGVICETANLVETDYLVVEAELSSLGEATGILQPHVGVLTQVSPVHARSRVDLGALTDKKTRLFASLAPGGTAVINRDIEHFERALASARSSASEVRTFGEHPQADFRLVDYDIARKRVHAVIHGERVEYELGLRGRHMAVNSLGVLAAGHASGVPWPSLLAGCASASPVPGRGNLESLTIGQARVIVIDDAYNASPASMRAAFVVLGATVPAASGRRIAVLADMLELGDDSPQFHRQLAEPLLESGVDKVYLAGDMMRHLWERLPASIRGPEPEGADAILRLLVEDVRDGDVILVKGSNGTLIHQVVADLRYLSLLRHLKGAGLPVFLSLKSSAKWVEPHLSASARRWALWQLQKLVRP